MAPNNVSSPRKFTPGNNNGKTKPTGFRVGPAHAAKDAYLGKAQKIKSDLIAHAKIKRTYARTLKSEGLSSARLTREAGEDRLARELARSGSNGKAKGKGKRVDNRTFGANVSGANEVGREGGMRAFGATSSGKRGESDGGNMDVDEREEGGGDGLRRAQKKDHISKVTASGSSSAPVSSWKTRAAAETPTLDPSAPTGSKDKGKKPMTAAWGAMAGKSGLQSDRGEDDDKEENEEKESLREMKRRAYGFKPRPSSAREVEDADEVPGAGSASSSVGPRKEKVSFLKRSASMGTPSSRRPQPLTADLEPSSSTTSSVSAGFTKLARSTTISSSSPSMGTGTRRTVLSTDGKIRGVLGGRHGSAGETSKSGGSVGKNGGQPRLGKRMGVLLEQIKRGRS